MGAFWDFLVKLHGVAGPAVTLLYPLYSSVIAIESNNKEDDVQWLTYWVLYSFVTLFEMALGDGLTWIPLWFTLKLVAACWLVLPQFKGAAFVYENYVREHLSKYSIIDTRSAEKQRSLVQMMTPESRNAVAKYISENGRDAFEKLMRGALKESAKQSSKPHYDY